MHGWTNSPEHRKVLLNDKYSQVGSGVFVDYYTQIYLEPASQKVDNEESNNEDTESEEPVEEENKDQSP